MPFIANTPESLLKRTDSLDPTTTCHGITSGGRPCRRPLNGSESQPRKSKNKSPDLNNNELYCWQHKEQAAKRTASSSGNCPHPSAGRRSSIDTLTERLGLTSLNDTQAGGAGKNENEKPVFTVKPAKLCCCFSVPLPILEEDNETPLPPRPRPHPSQSKPARKSKKFNHPTSPIPPTVSSETASLLRAELAKPISVQDEAGYIYIFWLQPESEPGTRERDASRSLLAPPSATRSNGQLSASDVLAAFANTAFDMLWDSDSEDRPSSSRSNATRDATRARERRSKGKKAGKKTILLKIGRATNVQRRLNEWKRQCGYDLSLVRYYPYIPSDLPSGSPRATPRKMPHSHKVERLIHIELTGAGLRVLDGDKCKACGKEHREWFEVEATPKAIREVDKVVKHWVEWDEGRRL